MVLTQHAVRVEQHPWHQTVSILPGDNLTAMQMAGENQMVAVSAVAFPASGVVATEDADITRGGGRGNGTRDCDGAAGSCDAGAPVMNPLPAGPFHGPPDAVDSDPLIVVAGDGQHRCDGGKRSDQVTKVGKLGSRVDEVAAEEYGVRPAGRCGVQDLTAQCLESSSPEMDVTHVKKPTRIGGCREVLLAHVEFAP